MKRRKWRVSRTKSFARHANTPHSLLQDRTLLSIIAGIMFGVGISTLFLIEPLPMVQFNLPYSLLPQDISDSGWSGFFKGNRKDKDRDDMSNELLTRKPLYVGVLTAGKFLKTRATACNRTWGESVSKLEFFSQFKDTADDNDLPIVGLPGIDDNIYPPQQKAFTMLQYMCQHHVHDYNWFFRADDDVYIKLDKLLAFLTTIDHRMMVYMGQPGHGLPEVRNKLGLDGHNFCMGGPGVVFSRTALINLCPHIDQCMKEVVSKEEDVEIGRCVTKHLGIQCTRSWEFLDLFYHAYDQDFKEEKPYTGSLQNNQHVERALTLHYAKEPHIMYRLHRYYVTQQLNKVTQDISELRQKIHMLESSSLNTKISGISKRVGKIHNLTGIGEDIWTAFTLDMKYTVPETELLRRSERIQLQQVVQKAVLYITQEYGSKLEFSHFVNGFYRYFHGQQVEYLVDLAFQDTTEHTKTTRTVQLIQPVRKSNISWKLQHTEFSSHLHFVVVVKECVQFQTFMRNFDLRVSQSSQSSVTLHIMVACQRSEVDIIQSALQVYKVKYPMMQFILTALDETSSQWQGYAKAFMNIKGTRKSLILFGSVYMNFTSSFLQRCHSNTIENHQVYTPVPMIMNARLKMSEIMENKHPIEDKLFIFSAYSNDIDTVNIFKDTSPPSFNKFVEIFQTRNINIFAGYDPGLI
ncbi:chondroitin sulfate synthase 3-like [Glandiceps talaboti]